ncbi:enolase C-terminal domain-like protein [Brevibacterium marinum]|uniref:L-alanine-DL-glutamate epimerase-like enolase superfamily enzyme n=1 Tax=Brevibacterium marinum TaxID=418643 RepID=A0A846S6L8_9MICO|nr:enolase C-terminal domain-like protein [Brevibacterium marinum]NJC56477.1 L-alanine-DL-glutamate epimerase-like enolase superfamily enzyme [Brevibacterium marinum]
MSEAAPAPGGVGRAVAGTRPAAVGEATISRVDVAAYDMPLEQTETDGTLTWSATTIVIVRVHGGGHLGVGYTYAPAAAARIVDDTLSPVVAGRDAMAPGGDWDAMAHAVRNQGFRGPVAAAVSAVDVALWDLNARLLGIPLVVLLDGCHDSVPAYGSGGFTNFDDHELGRQLEGWVEEGLPAVKIKVGTDPADDPRRVEFARHVIGDGLDLFVDGNGAYARKQALAIAEAFTTHDVTWFEEPVSSDDVAGLRLLRDRAPAGMEITAGEYGWDITHFRSLLDAGAVDCLQADVTRCGGITGLLRASALCEAANIDLSSHGAPQLSAHVLTSVRRRRHLEYFADHVRIEARAFDGVLQPQLGVLRPDHSTPGHGLTVRETDLEPFRVA